MCLCVTGDGDLLPNQLRAELANSFDVYPVATCCGVRVDERWVHLAVEGYESIDVSKWRLSRNAVLAHCRAVDCPSGQAVDAKLEESGTMVRLLFGSLVPSLSYESVS